MSVTSKGIPLYDSATSVQLDSLLNGHANALDAALVAQDSIISGLNDGSNLRKGTGSQRTAATSSAPEGSMWMDTDGSRLLHVKRGGGWVAYPSGSMNGAISAASGTTLSAGSVLSKSADGLVTFLLIATRSSWASGGSTLLATAPAGYRPVAAIGLPAATNGAGSPGVRFAQLGTDGAVSLHGSPTNGQLWTVTINVIYKAA